MIFDHLSDDKLFSYILHEERQEDRAVVEAHLQTCAVCSQVYEELMEIVSASSDPMTWDLVEGPDAVVDSGLARDVADRYRRKEAEDAAAAEAMLELYDLPINSWWAWLRLRPHLQTAGMVYALLADARRGVQGQPRTSLQIISVAKTIASRLTDRFDRPTTTGMVANERATALRFLGRYPEALAAVDEAAVALSELGGAPDEKARVAWNRASVLFAMEQYREARAALDDPKDWFRSIGDEVELARIGILEGSILHDEGDRAGALGVFIDVAVRLEREEEQPDLAVVYANIAFCHLALGHLDDARAFGERAIATYAHIEMLSERIRTRWMFAQLLVERGEVEEGLKDLRATASEYESAGMIADAALVELERVEILLRIDEWIEAASIARRLVSIYEASGQRLSYVQALTYLREAIEATTATPALARYVRGYLAEPSERPFAPPATPQPS